MRKLALLITTICIFVSSSTAQYYATPAGSGNPNEINQEDLEYPHGGGLPSGWTVIHNGNATNAVWTSVQSLPFPFTFNGSTVSAFKVSTSGVLTFTTNAGGAPSSANYALPHSSIPNNSVCVWGISAKGSNDKIVTKTFGTAPNRQHWISFNSYSIQTIFSSHYTFWSIVLEEGTNKIYIVDQRTSSATPTALTLGIQVTNSTAFSVSGSPSVNSVSTDDPSRADNLHYSFSPGNQPDLDIKAIGVILDDILAVPNGPFPVSFIMQNVGSDTITSLDLNYSNTSSLKTSATLTGLNILPWQTDTLLHPQPWSPAAGTTTLKVWAENLNGSSDQNNANDTTFKSLVILQNTPARTPLIESFTSSTSGQSSGFNSQLQNAIAAQNDPIVHVKYPMNWPGTGDPYFTSEAGERRMFYSVSTLPNMQLDGTDWNNFNNTVNTSLIATARNKMALVSLNAKFHVLGQTVCTDIEIDPLVEITNPDLTLYVAIYERKTIQNVKSSGETEFFHVMKKMLPNKFGTNISSLLAGVTQEESFCFTFQGNYILPPNANSPVNLATHHTIEEFSDLGVAVWLQDNQTKEVYQAAEALNSIGVETELAKEVEFSIFPNPTTDEVFVALNLPMSERLSVSIINTSGQLLMSNEFNTDAGKNIIPVQLPQLSSGLYILNVKVGDSMQSQKLIIE